MTKPENPISRPDVESIIREIRQNFQPFPPEETGVDEKALREEDNLHANLDAANASCTVGLIKKGGVKGVILRCIYKLFSVLIGEINQFHSSVIKVLNKLIKIIEGRDASSSEVIDNIRRRMDLVEKLSRRLDAFESLQFDERLKKLESRMEETKEKKSL